jgi:hypothetical protein
VLGVDELKQFDGGPSEKYLQARQPMRRIQATEQATLMIRSGITILSKTDGDQSNAIEWEDRA